MSGMFVLTLSVVVFFTLNVFTLGERVQEDSKCLSTLKDIKEAYFRGDYYPTDVRISEFDINSYVGFQYGFAMTMGYYRLTNESQRNNISGLDKFKKCCYPHEDDGSCIAVIVLHSPVYTAIHPLLLSYLSIPRIDFSFLLFKENTGIELWKNLGVACWNLPPICDNATSTVKRSLLFFTVQFNELSSYSHSESTSYSGVFVINNQDQADRMSWFHHMGEKERSMILLQSTIVFTIGPLTLLLLNKHKSYLKGVTKHSTFARRFLYSIMTTSTMGALYMYTGLVTGVHHFSKIVLSVKHFNPADLFQKDIIVGVSSVSMLTVTIVTQFPFEFYYFLKYFPFDTTKPWIRVVRCVGWCWVIVFVKILSFNAFYLLVMMMVNPVFSVIQTCLNLSVILTVMIILLSIFTCCRPPHCSIPKSIKFFVAFSFSMIASMALYFIVLLSRHPVVPDTHGVNVASIVFSLASSAILSTFVYFVKTFVQQTIKGEMNVPELQPLIQPNCMD